MTDASHVTLLPQMLAHVRAVAPGVRLEAARIEDDWLRRIGPAHFGHINFRGTMRFGIERFAQSLIDDNAGSARQLRLVLRADGHDLSWQSRTYAGGSRIPA